MSGRKHVQVALMPPLHSLSWLEWRERRREGRKEGGREGTYRVPRRRYRREGQGRW